MVNATKKEEKPQEVEKKFVTDRARSQGIDLKQDAKESEKGDPRKSRLIELSNRNDLSAVEKIERDALRHEYPGFDAKKIGR